MTQDGPAVLPPISSITPELLASLGRASAVPDRLVELFRDLILHGTWEPGSPIVETAIAKAVGVSQPSVREALRQLEAEGLILRRQYRSCEVTRLSREEVDQIYRLRVEWEAHAAELAVERRGQWMPDQLSTSAAKLEAAARASDVDAFYRCDLEFHKVLWACSGNPFLVKALTQITVPLFAFWTLQRMRTSEVDLAGQAAGHSAVARAVISGGKTLARRLTRQVIQGFWRDGARVAGEK